MEGLSTKINSEFIEQENKLDKNDNLEKSEIILISKNNSEELRNSMTSVKDQPSQKFLRASTGTSDKYSTSTCYEENGQCCHTPRGSLSIRGSIGYSESLRGSLSTFNTNFVSKSSITYNNNNSDDDLTPTNTNSNFNLTPQDGFNLRKTLGTFSKFSKITQTLNNNLQSSSKDIFTLQKELNPSHQKSSPTLTSLDTDKYKYLGYINSEYKREGFGVCFYKNGDKYSGLWVDDKKEGWGSYYVKSAQKTFSGEFKNNNIEGFVEYVNKSGVIHRGMMKNLKFFNNEALIILHPKFELNGLMEFDSNLNKLVGLATIKYKNGVYYEGETIENYESGWGITKNIDGSIIRGEKDEGVFNSYCEIESSNGDKYFGWFKNNKRHGKGVGMTKEGTYTLGSWLKDSKEGGFITCTKGPVLDIYLCGFLAKTIETKESIISYINLAYPEYRWLCTARHKNLKAVLACSNS